MYYLEYKIPYHTKTLLLIFHKANRCIKDYDGNKYLTLIFSEKKDKDLLKKTREMFEKIKYLIRVNNYNSDDMTNMHEIKINTDKDLPLECLYKH